MMGYSGSILGDIACGLLSQKLKSRKKAILIFMLAGGLIAVLHPYFSYHSGAQFFYWIRFAIGFGNGFFAILIAWIAEIFGTNFRATTTVLLSNLIRASVIPLTLAFKQLEPNMGLLQSALLIGSTCFIAGLIAALCLPETFSKSVDFLEN